MYDRGVEDKLIGLGVSRESLELLAEFAELLLEWQKKFNLIGSRSVKEIWTRHILDSAQLIALFPRGTRTIADLGSGAGFPGLVLAIAGRFEVHLFEANAKKCSFLREAARITGARAFIYQMRLEGLETWLERPKVDVVTSRALAPLERLLSYAWPFLETGSAAFFLKGQDVDVELTEATKYWILQYDRHPSTTDSRGVILEIKEAYHADRKGD